MAEYTLFGAQTPAIAEDGDRGAVTLGVRWFAERAGRVVAIRFFKGGSAGGGSHTVVLYDGAGTEIARAASAGETGSGWQRVDLALPVAVVAGTEYVVAVFWPQGSYPATREAFGAQHDQPPLHAYASGAGRGNGLYAYGSAPVFPTDSWQAANYFIDLVFADPGSAEGTPSGCQLAVGRGTRSLRQPAPLFAARPSGAGLTYRYDLVADFGAAPEDVAATTAALQAFHAEAQRRTRPPEGPYLGYPGYCPDASKDHTVVLTIPAGKFTHTYNKFMRQIRRIQVIGAGSGRTLLQNVSAVGYQEGLGWFGPVDYFGEAYDAHAPDGTSDEYHASYANYGYLIDSAPAGATRVHLKHQPSPAGKFLRDRWVLIYSYSQQQFGYGPNMRYYEWAKVTAADPAAGTITLDRPLEFEHRDDRPYYGPTLYARRTDSAQPEGQVGPARIAHIDHPDKPVGESHVYRGFTVLGNPNWQPGWAPQGTADVFKCIGLIDGLVEDIRIEFAAEHSMCKRLEIRDSSWRYDESDKIVGELIYDNCAVDESSHHAGQRLWRVKGGHIRTCRPGPFEMITEPKNGRNVIIDNGLFNPAQSWQIGLELDTENPTRRYDLSGITFRGEGDPTDRPIGRATQKGPWAITGSPIGLPHGNGTSLLRIAKTPGSFDPCWRIVNNWCEGFALWKNGSYVPGSAVQLITGDAHSVYIQCTGVAFIVGDRVDCARAQELIVQNCIGENTGFSWSAPWPDLVDTIPMITWTNNRGD